MDFSSLGIDEMMDMQVSFSKMNSHVKKVCKNQLKEENKTCMKCPFLVWILVIMDLNKWNYFEGYR